MHYIFLLLAVFSSVTVSLLGVNRGNMWLFDDSVLVTKKSNGTPQTLFSLCYYIYIFQFTSSIVNKCHILLWQVFSALSLWCSFPGVV